MLHENKENFLSILNAVAMQTGFLLPLIEKDYYLTLILSQLSDLSPEFVFKGGTCLNKIYFSYYRLSEDLDFSMKLPAYTVSRGIRRKCIKPIKNNIEGFAKKLGMKIEGLDSAGFNESKQYIYYFLYQSAVLPVEDHIKLEISLRFNPICPIETKQVRHKFLHPYNGSPLFEGGEINCLTLKELIAEKLRAAAIRKIIAPRDFYDIDFILRNDFSLIDREVLGLFQKKLAEDNADIELVKYRINLSRSNREIKEMSSRIQEELFDVLTPDERKNFNLNSALERINKVFNSFK